jgi:hypothetical protein
MMNGNSLGNATPREKLDPHYSAIKEFKRAGDYRFWELRWFDKLDLNLKNLEPPIETTLVPPLDPEKDPPELNDWYDFRRSMTVYVGGGQLPFFGHGVFFEHVHWVVMCCRASHVSFGRMACAMHMPVESAPGGSNET